MKEKRFEFKSSYDNKSISAVKWFPEKKVPILGIVQLNHGMAEHKERYKPFAEFLTKHGFIVYIHDHRGHGKTAKDESEIGYFAPKNGWDIVVDDIHTLTLKIKRKYPNIPLFLFGHSMGSLLVRDYITKFDENLSGVILSGTAGNPKILGKVGLKIAQTEASRLGPKRRSKLLTYLTFGNFNKKFKPTRTHFDWLSRDNQQVDQYIKDPFCGFICTVSFFQDLIKGTISINKEEKIKKIKKDLPILILSGSLDPVGRNTKGVKQVYKNYRKQGINNITLDFYKNARHELLNEINRINIMEDILSWIDKIINNNISSK